METDQPTQLSGQKRKVDDAKLDPSLGISKRLEGNPKSGDTVEKLENLSPTHSQQNLDSLLDVGSYDEAECHGNPAESIFYQPGPPSTSVFRFNKSDPSSGQVTEGNNAVDKRVTFHKETNMNRKTKPQPVLTRDINSPVEELPTENGSSSAEEKESQIRQERIVDHMKFDVKNKINLESIIERVDRVYRVVALRGAALWFLLVIVSFYIGHRTNSLERLTGIERKAPMVAAMLIGTSVFGTALPLFVRGKMKNVSGAILCAIVVHCVAFTTDILMANFPTPVFVDPVAGTRIYLLRWCEWTPLAFIMTFLTEACRNDNNGKKVAEQMRSSRLTSMLGAVHGTDEIIESTAIENDTSTDDSADINIGKVESKPKVNKVDETLIPAYFLAWCQGLSTFCGWIFPFCPGPFSWTFFMVISCLLYLVMFHRLYHRKKAFKSMNEGSTIAEQELYHWARLSLGLLKTCTFMWTVLVVAYFIYTIGPMILPESSLVNATGFGMICESIIDVLFKSVYMLIIVDVHDTIFDKGARAERRLEELRQMMGVVWDNSSDVICISVKGNNGDVTTMLSPTFLKIYSPASCVHKAKAIAFELDKKHFENYHPYHRRQGEDMVSAARTFKPKSIFNVEFGDLMRGRSSPIGGEYVVKDEEIGSMAHLVVRAWCAKEDETLLMHELLRAKRASKKCSIRCEANITRMEQNAMLIVVRDISERFRRFEAEKKVISETTARLKDAAANRFTRHEVKNGLLAAIGLCDSLRESVASDPKDDVAKAEALSSLQAFRKMPTAIKYTDPHNLSRYLFELDKTLHEILDTILAEAMARDVIHEVYEPKLERVDLPKLLYSTMNLTSRSQSIKRFPITTSPDPLPEYAMDTQLLKYIHRNAISNACKYGKRGGQVCTSVTWNKEEGMLTMDVINMPGLGHEEILKLGDIASEIVFSPRRRLTMHCIFDERNGESASHSSGDGAWIMHKCAKTLGGVCVIKFDPQKTVFTFKCPVTPYHDMLSMSNISQKDFEMPKNVWGIALDDSKIQRKLLIRFFLYAGIPVERIHIKGGTAADVRGFDDWAVNFVDGHPDDYFLMIIDENLDIQEEQDATRQVTISGSRAISEMRARLLPDQERRVLALIRSANDSASDVAIYNSRAHGFLPKAPIKKDSVREVIVPIWFKRFPRFEKFHSSNSGSRVSIDEHLGGEVVITMTEIFPCIGDIDKYASLPEDELLEKWSIMWEKLHALKGDLLIMQRQASIDEAIGMITRLRGPIPPNNFYEKWQHIRSTLLMV